MCTKPFSQTKNKGKLFLVAKSSGPLLARMPLKLLGQVCCHSLLETSLTVQFNATRSGIENV